MIRPSRHALVALLLALGACAPAERYPISGQECGPGDPVLEMSERCLPL